MEFAPPPPPGGMNGAGASPGAPPETSPDSVACLAAGGAWTDGDGATHRDQGACAGAGAGSVWPERRWFFCGSA